MNTPNPESSSENHDTYIVPVNLTAVGHCFVDADSPEAAAEAARKAVVSLSVPADDDGVGFELTTRSFALDKARKLTAEDLAQADSPEHDEETDR